MEIIVTEINKTLLHIETEPGIMREMDEHFSFLAPNYRYVPSYKNGRWDGRIHLYRILGSTLQAGLFKMLVRFAQDNGYKLIDRRDIPTYEQPSTSDLDAFYEFLDVYSKNEKIEHYSHQKEAIHYALNERRATILSVTSCHGAGDEIIMADGSLKKIEDVVIGELVMGKDGQPKRVLDTFTGEDDLYEVNTKYGDDPITVIGNHILPLKFTDKKRYGYGIETITVNDYLKLSDRKKHVRKLFYNKQELTFSSEPEPPCNLSPYFIGLYLGDGHSNLCAITNPDKECVDAIYEEAKRLNCDVGQFEDIKYSIKGTVGNRNRIFAEFDKIGLHYGGISTEKSEKYIPECLLLTSVKYRYELLAGLLDSDGHLAANGTYFAFVTKYKSMAESFKRLVVSLGFIASQTPHGKDYYRIHVIGDITKIPVRIERKKKSRESSRETHQRAFTVEHKGYGDYYGISVEDSYYLHKSGMVVHNSGKSLVIYTIIRFLQERTNISKILLLVPVTSLVEQMYSDFGDYSSEVDWEVDKNCHRIYSGKEKNTDKQVVISTWQSLYRLPKKYFEQFGAVLVDEVHTADAKSISTIMDNCVNADYRLGFTGTLKNSRLHQLAINGMFGSIRKVSTTKDLIEKGYITPFKVKFLVLKYNDDICKEINSRILTGKNNAGEPKYRNNYANEIDFISTLPHRMHYIVNLISVLEGNVLVLFNRVQQQGKPLFELCKKKFDTQRNVYYISGETNTKNRENVRNSLESEENGVLVASFGTLSTGVNIKSLEYVIFASPYKSEIKVLQSIGRILRKKEGKKQAVLLDIVDDMRWKTKENYCFKHFLNRYEIYKSEKFPVSVSEFKLL